MKNIAKCKKCQSIIESFHSTDYVSCSCGEISVDGGSAMRCAAKSWSNFARIDDEGNEILVTVKEASEAPSSAPAQTIDDYISMLDEMIKAYDHLPQHAMTNAVNHYDLCSALLVVSSIVKSLRALSCKAASCDIKEPK